MARNAPNGGEHARVAYTVALDPADHVLALALPFVEPFALRRARRGRLRASNQALIAHGGRFRRWSAVRARLLPATREARRKHGHEGERKQKSSGHTLSVGRACELVNLSADRPHFRNKLNAAPGAVFEVITNSEQSALGASGSHPLGQRLPVRFRDGKAFLEIRNVGRSEVLLLSNRP